MHPDPIKNSNLPAEIQELIRTVIKRSRLWKSERHALALELVSHFACGLEAGKSADELIKRFGEAKLAAKLMRRGKKRNRPVWWQLMRYTGRAIAAFILLYVGMGVLLAMRHPSPSVDYIVELNRATLAAPASDYAWPIYRDAWTKARWWEGLKDDVLYLPAADGKYGRYLRMGDAHWPEAVAFLKQQKPLLDAAREAGLKPSLGWIHKPGGHLNETLSPEDLAAFGLPPGPVQKRAPLDRTEQLISQSLVGVMLPHLAPMRQTATFLAADMRLAASEGDSARVLTDYRALAGMAGQCSQTPILVNETVGLGILALADQALLDVNQHMPDALSVCRVDLLHAMAATEPVLRMNIAGERALSLDVIQRVYSDNGQGDGTLTLDGLHVMRSIAQIGKPSDGSARRGIFAGEDTAPLVLPATALVMESRKEITEQVNMMYCLDEQDAARPLWVKLRSPGQADALLRQWKASAPRSIRHSLLSLPALSFERTSMRFGTGRATHEATAVVLALSAYRDKTGHYPPSLAELVPHYLPAAPLDHSTGGPLRYKLVDGEPLLYGLGKDGVDDGGVWNDKKTTWPQIPDTGDWVLYPPPKDEN